MMDETSTKVAVQRNLATIRNWLDAHNRQDEGAIDCYTEDIEIVEMPTGVIYKGMEQMRRLAEMAYRRKGYKKLTHTFATDSEACVEYVAMADRSLPLTDAERREGVHGVDVSRARLSARPFAMPVCYVCHFTPEGKIDRVREYWDVATMTRQLGFASIRSRIVGFFMRLLVERHLASAKRA